MTRRGRRPNCLPLGSISHGTMRVEDLIPKFLDAADRVAMNRTDRSTVSEIRSEWNGLTKTNKWNGHGEPTIDWTDDEREIADMLFERLIDILNAYCPPFTYFGTSPGDGSDYGVWISEDDVPFYGPATDEIGKGDCLPSPFVVKQGFWLRVNDHGNATLYQKRRHGNGWTWVVRWGVV